MTTIPLTSPSPNRFLTGRTLGAAAAVALLLGFVDLARGGITLAPVLMVLSFGVLIPIAIWRRGRTVVDVRPDEEGPPYRVAAIVGVAVLALYVLTLAPSTAMWDTSEYMTAAYTLGLPHPPGNPLFVLIGRVFSILPIAPSVAIRINLLAAICSAVAASMWFLVTDDVCREWLDGWKRRVTAVAAALLGATAFTVWNQSVVNEKVYTVSLAGIAIVSWLILRWSRGPDGVAADNLLLLVSFLLGLGYSNHMAGILPLPAVGLMVLWQRPRTITRWRLLLGCAALALCGLLPFATQPIRSAFNPPINEGEPTACRDGLAASCTFSEGTLDAFLYNFNRTQYGKPQLTDRQAPFIGQLGMWWLYFTWQWFRDAHEEHVPAQTAIAIVAFLLTLNGALVHVRRSRRTFWYFGPLMLTLTIILIYYLNFRYGASQAPQLPDPHEVRDRDYFFLWSFSALGVWLAMGLADVAFALASSRRATRLLWAPVMALGLVPLGANWTSASHRGDYTTLAFAHDLLNSVEPYSILITGGDNDTFPLWYAQEVEGIRKDVTVAVLSLMNTDWFARGMIRRPIYEYDEARGPAMFRGRTWIKPSGPPLKLTMAQADSLPPYVLLREPALFERPGLTARIDPRRLQPDGTGGGVLERADILVLRMLADSWPERPLYISRTTGGYAQRLGLGDHVITRGLAQAVVPSPAHAAANVRQVPGDGWYDVGATRALWQDTFRGPAAIIAHGNWVDRPSLSAPFAYVLTGTSLAQILQAQGDARNASTVSTTVSQLARAVRLDRLFEEHGSTDGADVRADSARRATSPLHP